MNKCTDCINENNCKGNLRKGSHEHCFQSKVKNYPSYLDTPKPTRKERNTVYWIHRSFIEEYKKLQRPDMLKAVLEVYFNWLEEIEDAKMLSEIALFILELLREKGGESLEQIRCTIQHLQNKKNV